MPCLKLKTMDFFMFHQIHPSCRPSHWILDPAPAPWAPATGQFQNDGMTIIIGPMIG